MNRSDEIHEFLRERTAPADSVTDFVFATVLHREFLRWRRERHREETTLDEVVRQVVHRSEPKLSAFVDHLDGLGCHGQELVRGERRDVVFDLVLLDQEAVEVERYKARERQGPTVVEQLRARQDLDFTDTTITAGTIVDRVEPGEGEKKRLDRDYEIEVERLRDQARPWVAILWQGKRRYVRSAWFERLRKDAAAPTLQP